MQAYVGTILLCGTATVLAVIMQFRKNKTEGSKKSIDCSVRFAFIYFACFAGILSLVKTVLGEGNLTIFESFADMEGKTYLHYGLPLLVMAVLGPLIIGKLFTFERQKKIIYMGDSILVFVILLAFTVFGRLKLTNREYVICLGLSIVVGLLISLLYKGEIEFLSIVNWKKRLKYALIIMFFWCVTTIFYLPTELFLTNHFEFPFEISDLMRALSVHSISLLLLCSIIGTYLLTQKQFDFVMTFLFATALAGYIQVVLLNGKMQAMDGVRENWSVGKIIINLLVWVAIIGLIMCLKFLLHKDVSKVYCGIAVYISLIQIVTMGYLMLTSDALKEDLTHKFEVTRQGWMELAPENNVVVFILDWFDEQIMEEIVAEDEDFLEPLNDFTWYTNATSSYAFTGMAIPLLLSGTEWKYDMEDTEYHEYAFKDKTYLEEVAEKNYSIGIYTHVLYIGDSLKQYMINYSNDLSTYCTLTDVMELMNQCARYKLCPFGLKSLYWYSTDDIWRLKESNQMYPSEQMEFYNALTQEKLKIEEDDVEGAFRFFHLGGPHAPYTMNDVPELSEDADMISQGKGSLKIVYEYIRQMKELGIYDDATIIITADHGQNWSFNESQKHYIEEYGFDMTSNPILFVKKAEQKNENGMEISEAPVAQTDLPATVIKAVQGDSGKYGRAFDEIDEDEKRERVFIFRNHLQDIPYSRYVIRGNVRDFNNWSLEN